MAICIENVTAITTPDQNSICYPNINSCLAIALQLDSSLIAGTHVVMDDIEGAFKAGRDDFYAYHVEKLLPVLRSITSGARPTHILLFGDANWKGTMTVVRNYFNFVGGDYLFIRKPDAHPYVNLMVDYSQHFISFVDNQTKKQFTPSHPWPFLTPTDPEHVMRL